VNTNASFDFKLWIGQNEVKKVAFNEDSARVGSTSGPAGESSGFEGSRGDLRVHPELPDRVTRPKLSAAHWRAP